MIDIKTVGGLYSTFPTNLKDAQTESFTYAVDLQIKKLLERSERAKVWCAIDSIEPEYLDLIAAESRTLFYNSTLPDSAKRNLIKNSIYWYMKLGTSEAMQEMIEIVFNNTNTSVEEWYTYAGEEFHFRIATSSNISDIAISDFLKYINEVKNTRSIFDYLILQSGNTLTFRNETKVIPVYMQPCGEGLCGEYPDYAYGVVFDSESLSFQEATDDMPFDYNLDNEKPCGA